MRGREKRKKTETEREETTKEKIRQDKMEEKKTEIMVWTDAESKFTQEKAKLANLNPTGINLQKAKLTEIQK